MTQCFHCQQPVSDNVQIEFNTGDKKYHFCCHGCEAVSKAILSSNLETYYSQRSQAATVPHEVSKQLEDELSLYDREDISSSFISKNTSSEGDVVSSVELFIEGITCAACIWLIEKHIQQQPGVVSIHVNHSDQRATLSWLEEDTTLAKILLEIAKIGYTAKPFAFDDLEIFQKKEKRTAILRIGIAGIGMMQNMMFAVPLYIGAISGITEEFIQFFRWVSFLVATPVVLFSARPFFIAAIRDLKTKHLTMDVPVSLAIGAAYLSSAYITIDGGNDVYFDSVCMFTFFLLIGRYLEMNTRFKASSGLKRLNTLLPASAIKITQNGQQQVVSVKDLQPGDRVVVKPGDNVPCDGTIVEGNSSIDESALTGEYLPVTRKTKDCVIAGTTNIESPLIIIVDRVGNETRIASVLNLMQDALTKKPNVALLADKVAGYFVVGLLVIASFVASYWYLQAPDKVFEIVLSVLVVTCPCALSLATPTALTAAMDKMRSEGILVLKAHTIETMAKITKAYFDKTGTLTEGKLTINEIITTGTFSAEDCLILATELESCSNHPIATAFRHATGEQTGNWKRYSLRQIQQYSGMGIEGKLGEDVIRLGNYHYIQSLSQQEIKRSVFQTSGTPLYLASKHQGLLAVFAITDRTRESAGDMISSLQEDGIEPLLVSGDHNNAVKEIADKLKIHQYLAEATPEKKLAFINATKQQHVVAMVGDGINDLPVMAGAELSIAMANAADINKLNADAVLLRNNLTLIPRVIHLARKTQSLIKLNITWAILYNLTALPLAAAGLIPPFMAAIGMSLSSVIVVVNSLRIKKA